MDRRGFIALAAGLGAAAVHSTRKAFASRVTWRERRDLFPEGVASGDPQADSVLLWTRYPDPNGRSSARLVVELAKDSDFKRVVASASVPVAPDADWTCRVLVGGLDPSQEYWYRFTDEAGNGSRIGRTITAPADGDSRPVKFSFVSCQNANQGAQSAYRRMIYEDERAPANERLGFVLHLGDFIYEMVWYPEDRPNGYYDRKLSDIVRYPSGEKISDFHVPTTVDDYRAVYRAYLHDPDIQDARARWPFVPMWDNHEFSWQGWQSLERFGAEFRPAQVKKVAANQAWFEYQPARIKKPSGPSLERFGGPAVVNTPVAEFDETGLGTEKNNLLAIESLIGYRALRFGKNVELLITDQRSYRSADPTEGPGAEKLSHPEFLGVSPEDALKVLDGGRAYNGGKPPESIAFNGEVVANFRKDSPPQTILGATQKKWFLDRLGKSTAVWKIWGNSIATLEQRIDPQHLPAGIVSTTWPGTGYAIFGGGDYSRAYHERGEIYDFIKERGITGFASVSGDRHSFWAGLAAKALPPEQFEPVGIAFVTGSISAPGLYEAMQYNLPKKAPLRALILSDQAGVPRPEPAINLLFRHGVNACLEYQKTGNIELARALSDPGLAPHLSFVDMGGHGYATVRASPDAFETEFVCIPRPVERSDRPDGAPLVYRVSHSAPLWGRGEKPALKQRVLEGDPKLSI